MNIENSDTFSKVEGLGEKVESVDDKLVVEQSFIEPVFFRYKRSEIYFKEISGLKKIRVSIESDNIKAYVTFSKPRKKYKQSLEGISKLDISYEFSQLTTILSHSFAKLMIKNNLGIRNGRFFDFTLDESHGYSEDLTNPKSIKSLDLVLYFVNNKLVGGYWLTIESGKPFKPYLYPRYVKLRRNLQKLQLATGDVGMFSEKLVTVIRDAFYLKANSILEYYGQD